MATEMKLSQYGVTFATRERSWTLVERLSADRELTLDFAGVKAVSPSFVDGLIGALAPRTSRVTICGLAPEFEQLVERVVERRGVSSQFRFMAVAGTQST